MNSDRRVQHIEMNQWAPAFRRNLFLGFGVPRNAIGSDMQSEYNWDHEFHLLQGLYVK